jgi:hypothetical protein
MSKIATKDNVAMNTLYKAELARTGSKVAATEDTTAFKDHAEYEKTVQSVLSEDSREGFDPNDLVLD